MNDTHVVRMVCPLGDTSNPAHKLVLKRGRISEKISGIGETAIEFTSEDPNLDLAAMVGETHTLHITLEDGTERKHHGTCTEAQFLYVEKGTAHYAARLNPAVWILGNTRNSRIFQQKDVMDIVKQVLQERGLSSYEDKTTGTFSKREYCVQYRESDLSFISRLLEEEGIYYFFDHSGSSEKIIFGNSISAHDAVPGNALIRYREPDDLTAWEEDHFSVMQGREGVRPGKVTLLDYDFERPSTDVKGHYVSTRPEPQAVFEGGKPYELFDYPGGFRQESIGRKYAEIQVDATTFDGSIWSAYGNVRQVHVGGLFTLDEHPRTAWNTEYLAISGTTTIEEDRGYDGAGGLGGFAVQTEVEIIESKTPFRAPRVTPLPDVSGVHVAVVVGKSGEEIWTDKYGRVKLQFFWDREGKKDDSSSCWVRVATPFAGNKWGMVHVPRIGQEVVVQFEEGNPDRPIVTGMMYNAENMPPYPLPANATMQGIKTNKSKGGGGFNELVFEDKAGAEYVRLQSERDYYEIIKNNADISIGEGHEDKGDLTETIHRHKTQTLKTGDHTFKIEQGSQTVQIKKDRTETIQGKRTQTVTKDVKETYKAKLNQKITGNVTTTVEQGNVTETLKLGNLKIKTSMGKVTIEAMQSIELKVGTNKMKIDMTGVTIDGMMLNFKGKVMGKMEAPIVSVKGQGMASFEAPMATVDGKALAMIKGGIMMVN